MFQLYYFKILKHQHFKELSLQFVDDEIDKIKGPYTTLIIGPNGTGKSQILSAIVEVFNYLAVAKYQSGLKRPFNFNFELKYFLFGKEHHVDCSTGELIFSINQTRANLSEINLPEKFIASSISLNDRYPLLNNRSKYINTHYEYLGVRSSGNSAYISYHIKKVVDSLSDSAMKLSTLPNIRMLFEKLSLQPRLTISFKPGRRFSLKEGNSNNIFEIAKSENSFSHYFQEFIKDTRSKSLDERRLSTYERILSDPNALKKAVSFLQTHIDKFKQKYLYKIRINYHLNFEKANTLNDFANDSEILRTLRELEIFSVDKVNLTKEGTNFKFEQASSGEYHLLTSFLGIISKIEDNSLILIDEPEISLHPNWQMQFMDVLNRVFENFTTCHFIIASHSHFLVSDLENEKSSILRLAMAKDSGTIESELLRKDTFGWTPENILYNIFNVASVSNHYFEMDLRKLARLISDKSKDFTAIRSYINKLERFEILPEDPLNILLDQAKGYLKQYEV
ncbi:AAA family ATPase [Terrimonas sp. NA20]|uniref:AAA family ATPase n=1 Tax=Terrimonas ginsenosidimutans TaxID=2908004 RepID=A0ABS9L0M0_9BACT|nr:AAA family ATPase [Terrimonas ginsenosidimutans]MCG2618124.1 AAA family ATPase [Terrimonas ginsenosidimutans]